MSKYLAEKTTTDGMVFDSKKEARVYVKLKQREDLGEISNLRRQVRYLLVPSSKNPYGEAVRKVEYVADFVYTDKDGEHVVDVKGYRGGAAYATFKIKKKLMWERNNIWVEEV